MQHPSTRAITLITKYVILNKPKTSTSVSNHNLKLKLPLTEGVIFDGDFSEGDGDRFGVEDGVDIILKIR